MTQLETAADTLELDMQFLSDMGRMTSFPSYAILKGNPEADKIAFSRLQTGARWTWAWFLYHNLPESWEEYRDQVTADDTDFVRYNVGECCRLVREWGKNNNYNVEEYCPSSVT